MSWATARAAVVTLLEAVEITSPISKALARVYATPPATVQDVPCAILYPPAHTRARAVQMKTDTYRLRIRLLTSDRDAAQAADIVDAFREATLDAFDSALTLGGACQWIVGPEWEEAATFRIGGRTWTGIDGFLMIVLQAAGNFAP